MLRKFSDIRTDRLIVRTILIQLFIILSPFRYDIQSQERELNSVKSELSKLNDIDERKMNTLKGVNKEVWQVIFL